MCIVNKISFTYRNFNAWLEDSFQWSELRGGKEKSVVCHISLTYADLNWATHAEAQQSRDKNELKLHVGPQND